MKTGAQIIIDSVDQTTNLTGIVQISIKEGKARTATFNLLITSSVTQLIGWVNKSVVIKSDIDSNIKTEFTGVIDTPAYDVETGITSFTCTDNMQESFETKTKAQIDAIITAYWSEAVFNDSEGWEYAQERMSTIPSALDMDELNAIRVTPWAAKGTPDYTFTDADFIYQSLKNNEIANRRNIVNAVNISVDYRYKRLKERQFTYDLDDGIADGAWVCAENLNPYPIPSKARIDDAIAGSGWEILSDIVFQELPPSGLYSPCEVAFIKNDAFARGVAVTLGSRYTQNVTEKYTIRVESADSIDAMGEIAVTKTASTVTDFDTKEFDDSLIADGWGNFGTPLTDINNDSYVNKDSATERQSALDTIINEAKTRILASHRNTEVTLELPYSQNVDVIHTAHINSTKLQAKGKVSMVVKTIDTFSGLAMCLVTTKLSKKFGVGVPGTENPPATPDGLPTETDTQIVDITPVYHLGGQDPTVYDPDWAGWITDYSVVTEPGHVAYPKEFVVNTPAITLNSVDNIEPTDSSLINVTIPDDTLS